MNKFYFNENIQELEIDPRYLAEGLAYAEKKSHNAIRIIELIHQSGSSFNVDLDLTPLSNSKLVKSLSIEDNFKISSLKIDALYTLDNLTSLSFRDKKIKLDFSRLPQLRVLYTKHGNIQVGFSSLTNLEHLLIGSVCGNDCCFLEGLNSLRILRISGGNVKNLSGIEQLSNLVELRIDHCQKLEDVSLISQLPKLEYLHIEKCKLLHDYSFLSGNGSIKKLFISELDSIAFVADMKGLEFLHFWNLKNGDLKPMLKSGSLKTIQFHPNKKNYSHTLSGISSQLRERHRC